ncbi:MAG: carboxypeptidase regulatory-like domain-containing protein, partial [Planctomycetes bacterium]|nr:carboxypeptidase regulatory-like domain-containing protein [Planctomycetota bacterium]
EPETRADGHPTRIPARVAIECDAAAVTVRGRVVDPAGAPVADAAIQAFTHGGGAAFAVDPTDTADAVAPPVVRTDDDGRFALRAEAAELLVVELAVSDPRFAPQMLRHQGRVSNGALDVPDIVLGAGAIVVGRVVDRAGFAVAAAEVIGELEIPPTWRGARVFGTALAPNAHTDADGRFALTGVPPTGVRLAVRAPGHCPLHTDRIATGAAFRVDCGTLTLADGRAIVGIVVDRAGRPIAGAEIELDALPATTTDALGRFEVAVRTDTTAVLTARHADFATATLAELEAATARDLRIVLLPRLALGGIVVDDGTGRPIDRFGIGLRAEAARGAPLEVTPHAAGRFTLTDLEPGDYTLDIEAPGYGRSSFGPIALANGLAVADLRLALTRSRMLQGRVVDEHTGEPLAGARVELFDGSATAADGADPRRFFAAAAFEGREHGARIAATTTARDGRFTLGTDNQAGLRLVVTAAAHLPFVADRVPPAGDERELAIALARGTRLFGTVSDLGEVAARLCVQRVGGARHVARIAPNGEYELLDLRAGEYRMWLEVLGGAIELPTVILPGAGELRRDVSGRSARPAALTGTVTLRGAPAAGLEVRLADDAPAARSGRDGDITAAALERIARRQTAPPDRVATDADGSFAFAAIAPGRHVLEIRGRRSGGIVYREAIELAAGEPVRRDVDLGLGRIEFEIANRDGEPTFAVVQVVRADEAGDLPPASWNGLPSHRHLAMRPGDTVVDELPATRWRYAIAGSDTPTAGAAVDVAAGSIARVAIRTIGR